MSDDIQTIQMDYADAMEMLWRQSQTIKRLQRENEKLRAAIFEKETVMQIRAAAAAALKETGDE